MSTVEVTLVVSRKEVPSEDEAAYHFFFLETSFFFSINYCYLQDLRSVLCVATSHLSNIWLDINSCLPSKIADFEVSALIPKHLIWYKQLFAI